MKLLTLIIALGTSFWQFSTEIFAHDLPISRMSIVADENALHVQLLLNAEELAFFREIDTNGDGIAGLKEIEAKNSQIAKSIVNCFTFNINDLPAPEPDFGVAAELGTHHLTVRVHYAVDARRLPVHIRSTLTAVTQRAHVVEVAFQRPNLRQTATLDARDPEVRFDYLKTAQPKSESSTRKPWLGNYSLVVVMVLILMTLYLARGTKI